MSRSVRMVTMNGETLPMLEWAKRAGLKRTCVYQRLHYGWSVEDAVTLPVGSVNPRLEPPALRAVKVSFQFDREHETWNGKVSPEAIERLKAFLLAEGLERFLTGRAKVAHVLGL